MRIEVPDELIPKGGELTEAYRTLSNEIIVMGEPDWVREHDCDLMGCGTFSHVIWRLRIIPSKEEASPPCGKTAGCPKPTK